MKKIYILMILILISSILLTGCTSTEKNENSSDEIGDVTMDSRGLPYIPVYKKIPIWFNPFLYISAGLVLLVVVAWGFYYFRVSLRNRTNVIIHMPDGKRAFYSYKKFTGDIFKIKGHEKTQDGEDISYNYHFRPEAVETGFFGSYIEYDYQHLEPLIPSQRMSGKVTGLKEVFKLVSALLNTDLAVDLLLSQKFKDLVKNLLIIILVCVVLLVILQGIVIYLGTATSVQTCILSNDSQNYALIRQAIMKQ